MTEEQIQEIWSVFKDYLDKKHVDTAAERFVDLMADYGVEDKTFHEAMGFDQKLDEAIGYYLDEEVEEYYDDEDDWKEWD